MTKESTAKSFTVAVKEESLRRVPPTKPEMKRVGYAAEARFLRFLNEKPWFNRLSSRSRLELEGEVGRLVADVVSDVTTAGVDPLRAGLEAAIGDLMRASF